MGGSLTTQPSVRRVTAHLRPLADQPRLGASTASASRFCLFPWPYCGLARSECKSVTRWLGKPLPPLSLDSGDAWPHLGSLDPRNPCDIRFLEVPADRLFTAPFADLLDALADKDRYDRVDAKLRRAGIKAVS